MVLPRATREQPTRPPLREFSATRRELHITAGSRRPSPSRRARRGPPWRWPALVTERDGRSAASRPIVVSWLISGQNGVIRVSWPSRAQRSPALANMDQRLTQPSLRRVVVQARVPNQPEPELGQRERRGQQAERVIFGRLARQARGHGVDEIGLAHDDRRDQEVRDAQGDAPRQPAALELGVDQAARGARRRHHEVPRFQVLRGLSSRLISG